MDFEELMKLLAKKPEDIAKAITDNENFGEEAQDAIKSRLGKVNVEAKGLRKRLKEAEENLKKNPALDVLKDMGLSIDDDTDIKETVTEFVESLKEGNKDITKNSAYIKIQKQLDEIRKQNEIERKEKEAAIIAGQKSKIINSLQSEFAEEISNGKMLLNLLVNSNKSPFSIEENDEIGYKLADGEIITGVKSIVNEYKKQNPDQVKNKSVPGANSRSSSGGNFQVPTQIKTMDQIRSMTAQQIANLKPEQHAQMMAVVQQNTNKG